MKLKLLKIHFIELSERRVLYGISERGRNKKAQQPICIVDHTVKGKGIEECEFNYKWHTHAPSVRKAEEFLKELSIRYKKNYEGIKRPPQHTDDGSLAAVTGGEE